MARRVFMVSRGLAPALAAVLALWVTACGGAATAKSVPPPAAPPPAPTAAPPGEESTSAIEYVVVQRRWVERLVPAAPADVKAWAEDPANQPFLAGAFRQILFGVKDRKDAAAVRKKAEGVLARIKKGEDFATLAKQYSDDAASKDRGGEYPPDAIAEFVEPVRAAYEALAPGQTSPKLVESKFGLHIVRKDRAEGDAIERAYKKAKAPEMAKKLAEDILARLDAAASARAAIADAVEDILGERGAADVNRPHAALVDIDRLQTVRLSAAAKAALASFAQSAHPGDTLPSPAVDGDVIVVARAISASNRSD